LLCFFASRAEGDKTKAWHRLLACFACKKRSKIQAMGYPRLLAMLFCFIASGLLRSEASLAFFCYLFSI
jgi:hypothetical protein